MNEDLLDDVGSVREKPSLLFSKISLAAAVFTILGRQYCQLAVPFGRYCHASFYQRLKEVLINV
jgi:hypothetical protein